MESRYIGINASFCRIIRLLTAPAVESGCVRVLKTTAPLAGRRWTERMRVMGRKIDAAETAARISRAYGIPICELVERNSEVENDGDKTDL